MIVILALLQITRSAGDPLTFHILTSYLVTALFLKLPFDGPTVNVTDNSSEIVLVKLKSVPVTNTLLVVSYN